LLRRAKPAIHPAFAEHTASGRPQHQRKAIRGNAGLGSARPVGQMRDPRAQSRCEIRNTAAADLLTFAEAGWRH
jgi:hypothetical protein